MKFTMKKWTTAAAVVLSCVAFAPRASATTLAYGDAHFIGYVNPSEPANESDEANYITNLIGVAAGDTDTTTLPGYTLDRSDSSFDCSACPPADGSTASKSGDNPSQADLTDLDVTGWTYLLIKYDGPNAGDLVWNVSDLTSVTVQQNWTPDDRFNTSPDKYAASHFTLFNPTEGPGDGPSEGPLEGPGDGPSEGPVPEPASLLLFGTALSAFGVRLRRAMR